MVNFSDMSSREESQTRKGRMSLAPNPNPNILQVLQVTSITTYFHLKGFPNYCGVRMLKFLGAPTKSPSCLPFLDFEF